MISPKNRQPKRGRPKAMSDETRKSSIVATAKELFLKNGYGRTTTEEIASCCRISKQTLYKLFPDKLSLFIEVIEEHRSLMLDFSDNHDDLPLELALEKVFRIDISPKIDQERIAFLRTITLESFQIPELAECMRKYGGEIAIASMAAWLDRHTRKAGITLKDPAGAAQMLMDLIFGAPLFRHLNDYQWPGADQRKEYVRRCISVFLYGLIPRETAANA